MAARLDSPSGELLCEVEQGIATVRINRPHVENAFNFSLVRESKTLFNTLDADSAVRVIVITGSGEYFGTGGDLRERPGMSNNEIFAGVRAYYFPLFRDLYDATTPTIAAINGLTRSGGVALALACDIRVASERAKFAFHEAKWGAMPSAGHCQLLPRVVGLGRAKELLLTGRTIDAREAERIGLVNRVVPHEETLPTAYQIAAEILENAPIAVRQIKTVIDAGLDLKLAFALDREAAAACYMSEDRLEGIAAFNEGRKPRYQNR